MKHSAAALVAAALCLAPTCQATPRVCYEMWNEAILGDWHHHYMLMDEPLAERWRAAGWRLVRVERDACIEWIRSFDYLVPDDARLKVREER